MARQKASAPPCCSSCSSLAFSLSCSTGTGFCNFLCYQPINLSIDGSILLALVCNNSQNSLLLLLKSLNYHFLFLLFPFQYSLLLFSFIQQIILMALDRLQLSVLVIHLVLFRLNSFTLSFLESRILTDERQAAIHL